MEDSLFGLATAPVVFPKILAPVLARLKSSQGITIKGYLDNLLLIDQSSSGLGQNVARAVHFLEHLGWFLNLEKSALQPVQSLKYLGLIVDTVQENVFLPQIKISAVKDLVRIVRRKRCPSLLLCMRLLGKMVG